MKEKFLIFYANPCTSALSDPDIQTFEDTQQRDVVACPFAVGAARCLPPRFECVQMEGVRMARAVVHCRAEVSERSLLLQRDLFRRQGRLPGMGVEAYVDPERGFELLTEPEDVVQRVSEHARAVLNLKPGERIRRPAALVVAAGGRRAATCKEEKHSQSGETADGWTAATDSVAKPFGPRHLVRMIKEFFRHQPGRYRR